MLTHSRARGMAESLWGNGGTISTRTSRPGAFYFSCSGHGGFVIDDRAFTEQERAAISPYAKPFKTNEIYNPARGDVVAMQNPFASRPRTIRYAAGSIVRIAKIWTFEEDCDWCLPTVFAGITLKGRDPSGAIDSFARWHAKSNHQLIEARGAFARHFPDHQTPAPAPHAQEA